MNYNVFDKLSLTYKIKEKATEYVVDKQLYLPGPSKTGDTWFIKTHVIVLLLCTRFDTERKYLIFKLYMANFNSCRFIEILKCVFRPSKTGDDTRHDTIFQTSIFCNILLNLYEM